MIFGQVCITHSSVDTHRDSYLLEQLTVVSVRRPLLSSGLALGGGLGSLVLGFADLLYLHELILFSGMALAMLLAALHLGQLQLLSRDLRGSELSGAIWGTHAELNRLRLEIAQAMKQRQRE